MFTSSNGKKDEQAKRIAELERMVGRLTMQLDMAKKVLRYSGAAQDEDEG